MQYGRVAWTDDRLVLKNGHRRIKDSTNAAGIIRVTENKAARHLLLFDALQLDLDILTAADLADFLLVRPKLKNLNHLPVGHEKKLGASLSLTSFNLAHHHRAHVLVLVKDGHAKGPVDVAVDKGDAVEVVEKGFPPVKTSFRFVNKERKIALILPKPRTNRLGYGLAKVGARQAAARHKVKFRLRVEAALFQVRKQLLAALVVAGLAPLYRWVVHLVDEHNQLSDT